MMAERKIIWSVCGDRDAGKTVVAVNLASAMASTGFSVLLLDADPASAAGKGAGAASILGLDPSSLPAVEAGAASWDPEGLSALVVETGCEGLSVLSGAGPIFGDEAPGVEASAHGFTRALLSLILNSDINCLVVDLGEASTRAALDLAGLSNEQVVVFTPSTRSVKSGFELLKSFVYRRVERLFAENPLISTVIDDAIDPGRAHPVRTFADLVERIAEVNGRAAQRAVAEVKAFVPALVLNRVEAEDDLAASTVLADAAAAYLGLVSTLAGHVRSDDAVSRSVDHGEPFATAPALDEDSGGPASEINALVENLFGTTPPKPAATPAPEEEREPGTAAEPVFEEVFGFNDNVTCNGTVFHVQTEVGKGADPYIETIVYQGGRVFLSKRSIWSQIKDSSGLADDIRGFAERQHAAAKTAVQNNKIMYGEDGAPFAAAPAHDEDGATFAAAPAQNEKDDGSASDIDDLDDLIESLFEAPPPEPAVAPAPEKDSGPGVAAESMFEEIFGFNDNVTCNGTVFHVQTEIGGGRNLYIETVVYQGGRVFLSKRSLWSQVGDPSGLADDIRSFAERQHAAAKKAVQKNKIIYGEDG